MNCNIFIFPVFYIRFLLPFERLFYLRVVADYQLNKYKAVEIPSSRWAASLGITHQEKERLRSRILRIQKSLEKKELLVVIRRKDQHNKDMCNIITPVVSDSLFTKLRNALSIPAYEIQKKLECDSSLDCILKSKLSTPIKYDYLNHVFKSKSLSYNAKLFIISNYIIAYKNYQVTGKLSFYTTTAGLIERSGLSRATIFRILRSIREKSAFLNVTHKYTYSDDPDSNRCDKSIHEIIFDTGPLPLKLRKEKVDSSMFN